MATWFGNFLLTVVSILLQYSSAQQYHRCSDKELTSFFRGSSHAFETATHSITNRTFSQYMSIGPMFFKTFVDSIDTTNEAFSIVDIGCGSGMALGGFLAQHPSAHAICVNKAGYKYLQSESPIEWARKMHSTNIPLMCNDTGGLSHPEFVLMKQGVTMEPIPLRTASFDLVMSFYAFDHPKINETKAFEAIMDTLPLMKVGGFAIILPTFILTPTYGAMNQMHKNVPHGSIVRSVSLRTGAGAEYSILFFVRNHLLVGMVVRRCKAGFHAQHPHETWGCFTSPVTDRSFSSKVFDHESIQASVLNKFVHQDSVKLFQELLSFTLNHEAPNVHLKSFDICELPVTRGRDICAYYYQHLRHFFLKLFHSLEVEVRDLPLISSRA